MTFVYDILMTVLPFIVLLTVLVFVHEMGHYLVARWCGVRVEVFSIGFGPELFGWDGKNQTRWKIAAIPLGGYVKFFGDLNASSAPDGSLLDDLSEAERAVAFHHKTLLQRVAIVFAGPLANILYAIIVLAVMYMTFGQRVTPPEIGRVMADSAAAEAGFRRGDTIVSIDGKNVRQFRDVTIAIAMNPDREMVFLVRRDQEEFSITATPRGFTTSKLDGIERVIGDLGILAASRAVVGKVYPDSAAEAAGFQNQDRIIAVDGEALATFQDLQDIVQESKGRRLEVTVERQGETLTIGISPRQQEIELGNGETVERWLLGIQNAPRPLVRYGPSHAVSEAVVASLGLVSDTVDYLGEMISGDRKSATASRMEGSTNSRNAG